MASLQCPSCGNRHPIDIVPDSPTFACQRCRRLLKVPDALRNRRVDAIVTARPAGTEANAAGPGGAAAPGVPGRVSTLASPDRVGPPAGPALGGSAAVPAAATAPPGDGADPVTRGPSDLAVPRNHAIPGAGVGPADSPPTRPLPAPAAVPIMVPDVDVGAPGRARGDGREGPVVVSTPSAPRGPAAPAPAHPQHGPLRVRWWVRFLVWVAALAIGAVVVVVPARRLDVIDFDGALNVIGGRGFEQWKLPLVIVPPWALVSAVIAHFAIEGIARLHRRSAVHAASPLVDGH
jgi:hypothetical protein